ncbi:EamA family transporter [Rurimicrobium arvi]|uniref:EamA domain-containing protein n=1 Tax=Rurimicrobium arvi TaxID=2049916 RepID=A0ABP8MSE9_9BACT
MMYLLLMVLLNALLAALFKLFVRFRVDNFQAIVVNYWVCVLTGSAFLGSFPVGAASLSRDWLGLCLLMGAGFISIFNLFAYCTRRDGITAATVANKLSLVIPVLFSIVLYDEHPGLVQWLGIVLAFPAVYLASLPKASMEKVSPHKHNLFWIVLLFIGSGLLDTAMKYAEQRYLATPSEQASYTIHLFFVAGTIGTLLLLFFLITGRMRFSWRNVAGGIALGVPNYFSIYFMIRMLNSNFIQSSAMIPLSNVGVLVASSLIAMLFFGERPSARNKLGLLLSLIVIALLAMS